VFVIGMGEVGRRLASALEASGVEVAPVTRESGWEQAGGDPEGLRLACVREEALPAVLERLRGVPGDRVVAVQNGWIRPVLEHHSEATRALIWFTSKGEFFRELRPSPLSGQWAGPLSAALTSGGLSCPAVDSTTFAALEADKMGFNCVVGLPLAVHQVSLGDYLARHPDEAEELFTESATICAAALGCRYDPAWWPAFRQSVEPLAWVAVGRAKALEYRNGAVVELAAAHGLDAPLNRRLLAAHEIE
jgi:hypothetical protein